MQACGKQKECIALYKTVERSHPQRRIRKEAANLRFILEAPKLTMSPEERVQLPVMGSADRCTTWHAVQPHLPALLLMKFNMPLLPCPARE